VNRPLLPAALLLAAILPAGPAAADGEQAPPRYALPEGWAPPRALPENLRAAADRAVADMTTPADPNAGREGWRVLAGIGAGAAPPAVAALGRANWFGRALLVRALGSMEDPGLLPVMVEAARDPAWAVREAAAEGIGLADGPVPEGLLPALLRDPSWRVRVAAVEAVRDRALRGGLSREGAARTLAPLSADEDPDARRAALLALADIRAPVGRPALLESLRWLAPKVQGSSSDDPEDPALRTALRIVRGVADGAEGDEAVLSYLWELGGQAWHPLAGPAMREWFRLKGAPGLQAPGALDRLLEVFFYEGGADPDSHAAAEEALVDLGDPAADALLDRLSAPERAVRTPAPYDRAIVALNLVLRMRADRAPETLARILRDRAGRILLRMRAANLGAQTCPRALGAVFREVYAGERVEVALAANLVRGIAASGGEDAKDIVGRALLNEGADGSPPEVRTAAAEVLEERPALRDPDAIRRAVAAEGDPEVLKHLLPVAVATLGDRGPAAVAAFLHDPRMRVRKAAVGALDRSPGADAVRLLVESLATEDGNDDRLPWYGEGEPTAQQKAETEELRRANAGSVREGAVSSLRRAAGAGAPALLRGLVEHADPAVRRAAAANLVSLGDEGAAPALADRIPRETDPGIRRLLFEAVASLGGPAADAAFERILAGDDADARVQALEALAGERARARAPAGTRRSLERTDAGPTERLAAIPALGRGRDPGAVALLAGLLARSTVGEERRTVLQALGLSRDPAAVPAVVALIPASDTDRLGADERETVDLAVETLGELRAKEAAAPLAALLDRALPLALSGGAGRAMAHSRQQAAICIQALGKCGGPAALDALAAAAFHPGFSRAAEGATADPLRLRPPRKEDERWRPELPEDLRMLGLDLAAALARWKDPELSAALRRRLDELGRDGRVYALAEEWLLWLGNALWDPPANYPYRPRWWSRVLLLRQALASPPRLTEADLAASQDLFVHEADVSGDFPAALRTLGTWRACLRVRDPVRADRDARLLDQEGAVVEAAGALKKTGDGAAAAASFQKAFDAERKDRIGRLVVAVLTGIGKEPALAVRFGELAVRADPGYAENYKELGVARLAADDPAGAAEAFTEAVRNLDSWSRDPSRDSASVRGYLGRALFLLGKKEEALRALGAAALLNDVVLDWIERDPLLAPLREGGRLDEALEPARRKFE
jgi:HEAT repeat protein